MENTPKQIALLWLTQFDERLGWLEQVMDDLDPPTKAVIHHALDKRRKVLDVLMGDLSRDASRALRESGNTDITVHGLEDDLVQIEVTNSARRSDIQRDDLVAAVLANATVEVNRDTGEVETLGEARLRALQAAFRLEPRWTEVKKLGIDPDEYATTTWNRNIKTRPVVVEGERK